MSAWNPKANDIFLRALELRPHAERDQYVGVACAGDEALRADVEALLAAGDQAGSFLESPAVAREFAATIEGPIVERLGTMIGRYKLLEQIGEGGFGIVFMAEQQEPVRRKVALKVLKPGMDTRQVVARFEAERQALALMDHPHIAHVFDGGTTAAGRPYFVMDLVKGVPITEFCDQNQVVPRERLDLFVQVCEAVQHAHQKGIIHRDVKPSNVLISRHDGTPVVKVIDFGIAKALGQQLTEKTLFTNFGQLIGTPLYMSPEQAGMSDLDVDTRSDIYSLGVLLYELLTGTTPFDAQRFKEAGFDEMRRIIREEEPPKPSTRISTVGKAAETVSANRQSDPKQLSRLFRGELDWIVMKALEKDRNRRYETANGVAADVRRYLNDEPVRACPPSSWYRFRKFARRNKGAMLAAAIISATLISAVALLSVSYLRLQAEQQRTAGEYNRAEAEKGHANEERAEAESRLRLVLQALDEVFVKEAERLVTLRQRATENQTPADPQREQAEHDFLEKGLRFYEQLAQRPGTSAEARHEMGRALFSIGHIRLGLGHFLEAERAWRQAARLFEKLSKQFPDVTQYAVQQADACEWLYVPLTNIGRNEEAEQVTREALAIFEQTALRLPTELRTRKGLAICHDRLARMQAKTGRLADAMRDFQTAEKFYSRLAAEFPRDVEYRETPADLQMVLAYYSGREQRAVKLFADAAAAYEKLAADTAEGGTTTRNGTATSADDNAWFRHEMGYACIWQGDLLRQLGQLPEAEAAIRKGLNVHEKLVADFPAAEQYISRLAWSELSLGNVLNSRGQRPAAEKAYRNAVALQEPIGVKDAGLGIAYEALGTFYKEDARIPESLETWRKSLALWERLAAQTNDRDHRWHLAGNYWWVGTLLLEMKDAEGAIAALLKARDLREAMLREWPDSADYRVHLLVTCQSLSSALRLADRQEEALELLQKLADIAEKRVQESPIQWAGVREAHAGLADARLAAGQLQAGVKAYGLAIEQRPNEPGVWGRRSEFYAHLGLWELAAGDAANACRLEPAANTHRWLMHALLSLQAGDSAAYRQICQRLPELFSLQADCAELENELVRACTIAPVAEANVNWAVRVAEKGAERNPQAAFEQFALGLARYRAGDDEGAIVALEKSSDWLSGRLSNPVLAMAYHRQGREEEARASLDRATREIDPVAEAFLRNPAGFMPMFWWDWLSCLVLYREARTLVEGTAPPDDARLIVAQARAWAALGETKQANAACRSALALSGDNGNVCLACETLYTTLVDADESAAQQPIRLQPDSPVGRLRAAARMYGEAVQHSPKQSGVWWGRSAFYTRLSLWDLAAHDVAVAFELDSPTKAPKWLPHALLRLYAGDTTTFRQLCRQLPGLFSPQTDHASHENGLVRACTIAPAAETDLAWAVEMAEMAVERQPDGAWNHAALGLARYRAGDDEGAITALKDSTAWLSRGHSFPVLAMAYHRLGRADEALEALRQATQAIDKAGDGYLHAGVGAQPMNWWDWLCCLLLYREAKIVIEGSAPPDDPRLIVAQARSWAALGETKQADAACRRAVELSGENADICFACATVYAASEKWSEAESAMRQAIRMQPYAPGAHFMLALATMNLGKHAEAIEECHEAICLYPDYAIAHNNLAWSLATCPEVALRDPLRAVVSAKRAVELSPMEGGYWNTLGVAHYRAGDFTSAIETLTKSMELRAGGDGCDWFFLAMAHWHCGEKEESAKWYGQAVEWMDKHQPHDEELKRFRAEAADLLALGPAKE